VSPKKLAQNYSCYSCIKYELILVILLLVGMVGSWG